MIVDASVALKWLVREQGSDAAEKLLDRIDLSAPTLLHAEVANALWKKQRLGELDTDINAAELVVRLAAIIQTVDETPLIGRALAIAATLAHPVYDCIYIALAEQFDRPLVTADKRLVHKTKSSPWRALVLPLAPDAQ